jgi:uncharacterized protein (DUF2062 family)
MALRSFKEKTRDFFIEQWRKIVSIDDSNQRIALGFGLGVFLGVFPGVGPLTALILAGFFKINRIAALLGVLLFNTWLTFATFILSVKLGSWAMHLDWRKEYDQAWQLLTHFKFANLFKAAILETLLPILLGYIIIAFFISFVVYLVVLGILTRVRKCKK